MFLIFTWKNELNLLLINYKDRPSILLQQMDKQSAVSYNLDNRAATCQKELKSYELSTWASNEETLIKKHGPILFFKTHEAEYPFLSGMAKAISSLIPASASIANCFSGCANIVTTKRNATATTTLENLIMNKSHNIFSSSSK